MRTSNRKNEGCLIIDHTESPGIEPGPGVRGPAVGKGQRYVSSTYNCQHCQRVVILNPKRTRSREWCQKCGDYICDLCAAYDKANPQLPHRSFAQVVDEIMNAGARGETIIWRP